MTDKKRGDKKVSGYPKEETAYESYYNSNVKDKEKKEGKEDE